MSTELPVSDMSTTTLYCSEAVDSADSSPTFFFPGSGLTSSSPLVNTIEAKLAGLSYDTNNVCSFFLEGHDGVYCFSITRGTDSTQVDYSIKEYCPLKLNYVSRAVSSQTLEGVLEPSDRRIVNVISIWLGGFIAPPVCSLKPSPSRQCKGPCEPSPEKCRIGCWNTWCGVCGDGLANYGGGCCVLPRVKDLTKYATIDAAIRKSASKHKWSDEETTQSIAVLTALVEPFKSRLQKVSTLQADGSIYLVDIGIVTDVKYTQHKDVILTEEIVHEIIP